MNRGKMLSDANHVLVQISGGPGMTLTEVEIVMQELNRHVEDHTQILFGTSVDGKMGNRLSVTLISSISAEGPAQSASSVAIDAHGEAHRGRSAALRRAPGPGHAGNDFAGDRICDSRFSQKWSPQATRCRRNRPSRVPEEMAEVTPPAAEIGSPPPVRKERKPAPIREREVVLPEPVTPKPLPTKKDKYVHARQEVMQFEPVTRGRFEKSEPTIVEGQDLDVPTYLRKNVRVK